MKPEVIIDGVWLSSVMPWGDLEWTTCWPGGTESISFGVARDHRLFRPDAIVELDVAGERKAVGALVEPSRGEPLLAEGLHRKAEDYGAFTSAGDPATGVHEAVDQAIARGWQVKRGPDGIGSPYDLSPVSEVRGMPYLDADQPHSVAQYLDQSATERGAGWGVDASGFLFMLGWGDVSLHMLPGVDGLASSRDGYASTLYARYLDSGSGLYATAGAEDAAAVARWGRVERTLTEPLGEGAPMTLADAQAILQGALNQGRSQMGWASQLEVQYGDVVSAYGQPVDLTTIHARRTIRLHGLAEDVADLSGRTWVDVPIARTHHAGARVTIEPRGLSQPMNDALAGLAA